MLKQHVSSIIAVLLFIALCGLNVWLTRWHTPTPWDKRGWSSERLFSIPTGIFAVLAFLLWAAQVVTWQLCLLTFVCLLVARHDKRWTRIALVSFIIAAAMFVTLVPSVIAVYVVWLLPMVALAGFLPRLMTGLQLLVGRKQDWLMDVRIWFFILLGAPLIDAALMPGGAADLIRLSFEFGLIDQFVVWFNNPWLSPAELLLEAQPRVHIGVFTMYATFGFQGVLALWARKSPDDMVPPAVTLLMLSGPLTCLALAWLLAPSGGLVTWTLAGSQIVGLLLLFVVSIRSH